jgi:CheY-specific phosphatase CheX
MSFLLLSCCQREGVRFWYFHVGRFLRACFYGHEIRKALGMDPLLDEKIVLTVSRSFVEYMEEQLHIQAWREAYGPSVNEGLCYESTTALPFSGDFSGSLYFCMDGYTRLKLLPLIAETFQIDSVAKGMADSILAEFANQISFRILHEFDDAGYQLHLQPPESLNHKLVSINLQNQRQYIVIFFIEDRQKKQYLGRCHVVLVLDKF